jgi:hypothetical protein
MTRYKEEEQFGKSLGFFQYKSKMGCVDLFSMHTIILTKQSDRLFSYPLYYLPGITPSLYT